MAPALGRRLPLRGRLSAGRKEGRGREGAGAVALWRSQHENVACAQHRTSGLWRRLPDRRDGKRRLHALIDVVADGGGRYLLKAGWAEAAEEDVDALRLGDRVEPREHVRVGRLLFLVTLANHLAQLETAADDVERVRRGLSTVRSRVARGRM
eukprot:scaffold113491_cov27-Tisochrysis_lutea.AAC.2